MLVKTQNRHLSQLIYLLAPIFGGAIIAGIVTLLLLKASPVWIFLIFAGLLVLLPTFVVKDIQQYWLALFLLFLAFDIKKNLDDGLRVMRELEIDYLQFVLVPELRLSDLALLVLLGLWVLRISSHKEPIYFPGLSYLALAYLGWAALSSLRAPYMYLSVVELMRESKFFLIYLYAANNINSKRTLRLVAASLLFVLFLQGTVTIVRYHFQFGFIGGNAFGQVEEDLEKSQDLVIESSDASGKKRGFGTLPSPASTAKHLILLLPLALLFSFSGSSFSRRSAFFLLFLLGSIGLLVTFSRTGLVAFLVEIVLCLWFGYRRDFISRRTFRFIFVGMMLVGLLLTTGLSIYLSHRPENVTIRMSQYEAAARMIQSNPILGVGLNNSAKLQKYYNPYSSSALSRDPTKASYKQPIHSYYLALTSEIGIVGLVLYMGFFILIGQQALYWSRSSDFDIALFSTILLISIVGLFILVVGDPLFEDTLHTLLWFYAGVIVAFGKMKEVR